VAWASPLGSGGPELHFDEKLPEPLDDEKLDLDENVL